MYNGIIILWGNFVIFWQVLSASAIATIVVFIIMLVLRKHSCASAPSTQQASSSAEQAFSPKGQSISSAEQAFSPKGQSISSAEQAFSPKGQSISSAEQAFSPKGQSISSAGQASAPRGRGALTLDRVFLDYLLKGMALLFFAWCIARSIFYDAFILVINGGRFGGIYYKDSDLIHSILRWGHNIATVVFPMAAFFRSRLFKNIAIFVCLPFAIAALANADSFLDYYTLEGGRGLVMSMSFREFYLAFDFMLAITFPLLLLACDRHFLAIRNRQEITAFLLALPFVIIRMCPVNVPQSIFGYTSITYNAMSIGNILWIFLIIAEVIVLNRMFRFKEKRERYMLCMFLALVGFVEFNSLFMMGFNIRRLPFQLCNLGPYFFLIALLTKKEKFFNFVFLANITGAAIAILSPDTEGGGAASFWAFHYFVEHTLVLVVPLMCNLLRIFPRINKTRALKHLTVGFACYFLFCLILGTILNGITDITKQPEVNFFYIFDVVLVVEVLPFVAPLTKGIVLFDRFVIYPFFQLTVFALFWLLCVMVFYIVQAMYEMLDDNMELRLARISLTEKITGKKSKAITEYPD